MNYELSYREKHNLNESDLTDAQRTLHYIAENMRMQKSISEDGYKDFQQAIKALEQQPCEDAISRKDMLAVFRQSNSLSQAWNGFEKLPPVTPKEKTGHWIIKDGKEQGYDIGGIKTWYIQIMCDKCGFIKTAIESHTGQYHFCPNCGARMQEVEKNG